MHPAQHASSQRRHDALLSLNLPYKVSSRYSRPLIGVLPQQESGRELSSQYCELYWVSSALPSLACADPLHAKSFGCCFTANTRA